MATMQKLLTIRLEDRHLLRQTLRKRQSLHSCLNNLFKVLRPCQQSMSSDFPRSTVELIKVWAIDKTETASEAWRSVPSRRNLRNRFNLAGLQKLSVESFRMV